MDVKIPWYLFLKMALLITTIMLGPGDIAPIKHTKKILLKIIMDTFIDYDSIYWPEMPFCYNG